MPPQPAATPPPPERRSGDLGPQRRDPVTGRVSLIAEGRARRPNQFDAQGESGCPFCAGAEDQTPATLQRIDDARGGWLARAIPNLYPAVSPQQVGLAPGLHEVLIESPRHVCAVGEMTLEELVAALSLASSRLRAASQRGDCRYRLAFKNQGLSAGASLRHVHSQLIALAEVPPQIAAEVAQLERRYATHHECSTCELLRAELQAEARIVAVADGWVALCPMASRQPLEVWVVPLAHEPRYEAPGHGHAGREHKPESFARFLQPILRAVESASGQQGLNWMLHTSPQGALEGAFHWRLEVLPRVSPLAGFELATGMALCTVSPERAAERLRVLIEPASGPLLGS